MPSRSEEILVFFVISVLVGLFAWIYRRNRERRSGMWLLGWIAILVHFAVPLATWIPGWSPLLGIWVNRATLIVAGTFFLLSVSVFYAKSLRAAWFIVMISLGALVYVTLLVLHVRQRWLYLGILILATSFSLGKSYQRNGWKSRFFWFVVAALAPYATWTGMLVAHGKPGAGLDLFLFGLYTVTGGLYYRHFRRLSPGVLLTSVAFMAWGSVFPVAAFLASHKVFLNAVIWDLPKYFVALGMILTLFEREADVALGVAQKYQALFEDNLAAVYVSSFEGKLLDCNAAFLKMYGFLTKEEAAGSLDSLPWCDTAEREAFISTLLREGQVLNHECRHRRKDGTPFWILERATIVNHGSGNDIIEGTAIEITERKQAELALKQSEERFSKIFRQSPVACCIVSLEGKFLDANDHLLKMLGREAHQVIGETGLSLGLWKTQQQRDKFYRDLREAGSIRNLATEFKDPAGNRRDGSYFATLVRVDDKECIFGMLVDLTEQRDLQTKFIQAQKMEALGRLAGGIAHDFNNLLGVIGGYAELLETKLESDDRLSHYCAKILDTTQRAGSLTRQLLTFSRKEVTRPMPLRPDQALAELAGILPSMVGEDIEISLDLGSNGVVVIDQTHFEQIVINVVVNSRDAMPNGGQLFISTEDVFLPAPPGSNENAGGQHFVALSLRDTGCGMTSETRSHAFEPFYTTKEIGRGTGLGLATVYAIVQQIKGELKLESNPGEGTRIAIFLPATSDAEIRPVETGGERGMDGLVMHGSRNILLVEDEADLRASNAEFLKSIGYSVRCASTGLEALAMLDDMDEIDLVITDVVMPKMNGREFAERLLHARPAIKLLFISGYADDVLLHDGFCDAGSFLQKPYTLRELAIKVSGLLYTQSGLATRPH
jgi:PAS domain S-box-containing protein